MVISIKQESMRSKGKKFKNKIKLPQIFASIKHTKEFFETSFLERREYIGAAL